MQATEIVLAARPVGLPTAENFRFQSAALKPLGTHDVHVEALYFSVDPYLRGRMNAGKSYIEPFEVGQPFVSGAVARVVASASDRFQAGDVVHGMLPWATHSVVPAEGLRRVDTRLAPESYYLGLLGMPGLTAYFGLLDVGQPKAGETVVVSGAAGAVGLVVGQIAKLHGCHVVGIAGSAEKVAMLRDEYGFDAVINYKSATNLHDAVAKACPRGVDVYFDNVGGPISDAVLAHINKHARLPVCGQIAFYNATEVPMGPRLQPTLLVKSATMRGFLVFDYEARYGEAFEHLAKWLRDGKLKYTETLVEGFEQLPKALLGLFHGDNAGKMVVKV